MEDFYLFAFIIDMIVYNMGTCEWFICPPLPCCSFVSSDSQLKGQKVFQRPYVLEALDIFFSKKKSGSLLKKTVYVKTGFNNYHVDLMETPPHNPLTDESSPQRLEEFNIICVLWQQGTLKLIRLFTNMKLMCISKQTNKQTQSWVTLLKPKTPLNNALPCSVLEGELKSFFTRICN